MYKVFDNLIPKPTEKRILDIVDSDQFKWFALDNLSLGEQKDKYSFKYSDGYRNIETHGMSSLIYRDDKWFYDYNIYMIGLQIIDYVLEKEDIQLNRILRMKFNFLTQNVNHEFNHSSINTPHIDDYNDHKVLVYYLNDSDGDTILFNEEYPQDSSEKTITLSTQARVTPKQGRILLFNGKHFHTSQNPINSEYRLVLNINFC